MTILCPTDNCFVASVRIEPSLYDTPSIVKDTEPTMESNTHDGHFLTILPSIYGDVTVVFLFVESFVSVMSPGMPSAKSISLSRYRAVASGVFVLSSGPSGRLASSNTHD